MIDFAAIATQNLDALREQCLPFWLKNACDGPGGGYFDFLLADGQPLDAHKTVARQAEQVWAFAHLYNTLDAQPDWLDHALHGADFLAEHAHAPTICCHAQLDRLGRPVLLPNATSQDTTDVLTTARVAAAYAQIHQATADDQWAMLAKQTLHAALRTHQTARDRQQLAPPNQPQPLRHLGQPLALLRALADTHSLFAPADWKEATEPLLDELLTEFLDKRHDILREYVGVGGAFSNTPEGRRIATGLTMEAVATIIDVGTLLGNRRLTLQATNWCLRTCEWAWPNRAGGKQGLARWLDWKQQPLIFDGADHQLAADHLLALTALANGYWHTRHPDATRWIRRLHDYTFRHFADAELGWYLALNGQQQPVGPFKSTADTNCYALIRGLADSAHYLRQCARRQPAGTREVSV